MGEFFFWTTHRTGESEPRPTSPPKRAPTRADFPVFSPSRTPHEASPEGVHGRAHEWTVGVHLSCFHLFCSLTIFGSGEFSEKVSANFSANSSAIVFPANSSAVLFSPGLQAPQKIHTQNCQHSSPVSHFTALNPLFFRPIFCLRGRSRNVHKVHRLFNVPS